MKSRTFLLTLALAALFFGCTRLPVDKSHMVNPILGDISYVNKFGYAPDASADNDLRVKTHLAYVEQLLRQKDVSFLSPELQKKRKHMLDLLHDYWNRGVFPKNYDHADQRKPCFIDRNGTICAVGYLIEQTTSRGVANAINATHQYDELLAMNDPAIDNWVKTSGLTKTECAMIQPTYQSQPQPLPPNTNYITPEYGMTSFLLGGLNLSLCTFNGKQMVNRTTNKTVPVLGIMTGAGQLVIGTGMLVRTQMSQGTLNESQKNLSILNIGLGSATLILSTWNLATKREPKEQQLSFWNVYSFQTPQKNTGFALSLKRKF